MSYITRLTTLSQDEILGTDDNIDLTKVSSEDHELNKTMNKTKCVTGKVCQNESQNCPLNVQLNKNQQEVISLLDEDPEFSPMIATRGKQLGSIRYIWDGYVYTRDGYSRSFRCSNRTLYECPGRAVLKDGQVVESRSHSHPREPEILQVERVKQEMITRAKNDKSVALRKIYLEACKTEPLVRSHLELDAMLSKMKKARRETLFSESKPSVGLEKRTSLTVSLHVWDPNTSQPTSGLGISLYKEKDNVWRSVCRIQTDERGKCADLLTEKKLANGNYKLRLDTRSYYSKQKQKCLYPFIEIVFEVERVNEPYHFSVQLSPFTYKISRLSL